MNTGGPQPTLGWVPEDTSCDFVLCCVLCVAEEEADWGAWAPSCSSSSSFPRRTLHRGWRSSEVGRRV